MSRVVVNTVQAAKVFKFVQTAGIVVTIAAVCFGMLPEQEGLGVVVFGMLSLGLYCLGGVCAWLCRCFGKAGNRSECVL